MGIGISRSGKDTCIVHSLTWVLQSDGDLYQSSFAPLFFHRREISDEIRMNTRSSKGGSSLSGEEGIEKRDTRRFSRGKYIYICMEFLLCSRIIRTRKCVHFSFFCERRQFVSLSSKRDSYYRDARERGGKKKKKNLYFFIKFLIFLTSASFSGFFLTILFHDREQNSSFRIMKIINYARKVSFLLHVEIII